jgi:type I restriction enzyme S subunit
MKPIWTPTQLGDLLVERRETPQPVDLASGAVRIVSKIGFNEGKIELRTGGDTNTPMILVRPGDLLVSGINAAKGAIAIYGETNHSPVAATIHYGAYSPSRDRVDTRFLWWLLRSGTFRELLLQYVPGGIKTELKAKRLLPIPIPLPPLSEQKRIVARIEELAGKIEEAKTLRREGEESIDKVVGREIARIFGSNGIGSTAPSTLGDYVVSDCYGTSEKTHDDTTGVPVLRMGNIQDGRLTLNTLKYLHIDFTRQPNYRLKPGDILVNRTNSAELVGKCAVFDERREFAFASYLIRVRLDLTRANPWLVAKYINSPIGREYMFKERKQMTGQANVNSTKLKAMPLRLPSLPEQNRIAAYLDDLQSKVDSLKKLQAESSAELDALLPSILDKAFKGEL